MNDTTNATDEVTIIREFDAPREVIFKAFMDPEQLVKFWGPVGTHTPLESVTLDPRPGGVFATTMVPDDDPDGAGFPMHAVFVEVVEPERFTFREPDVGITTASTFEDLGGGRTRLIIHQTSVPEMYRTPEALEGFNSSLDRLAAYLTTT
jgi:uncharacterized protein YndB with AHSA1/START domain